MKVTLYREDHTATGWFYILQAIGKIPDTVEHEEVIDDWGDVRKTPHSGLFDTKQIVLDVKGFKID